MSNGDTSLLTAAEVAGDLRVSPSTVARWAREGLLPCVRTPGGKPRFRREDVEAILAKQEPAA